VKSKWLHRKKSDKLIFFCNGWGMDEHPFTPLESSEWNVLMFYDYTDLRTDQNLVQLIDKYTEVVLVAWSMGVWVGQQLFHPFSDNLTASLAINGSLKPIDDQFGIPEDIAQGTHDSLDEKQRLKFYGRMCKDRTLYRDFLTNQPQRSVESQKIELGVLLNITRDTSIRKSIYDCVLVSEHDYIIPTKSQLNFWPEKIIRHVNGSHFLFYSYENWDDIVGSLMR
jgi:pimeloyl-[acyl-carrier protein] methyl ester esterase